jgi:hypothetical protein
MDKLLWPIVNAICLVIGAIVTIITLPGYVLWG